MITKEQTIETLKTVMDPEIQVDVWTLGLIYNIKIEKETVDITMTFTSPMCPYGPMLVDNLKAALQKAGAKEVNVDITFEPVWKPSEELREMLGV